MVDSHVPTPPSPPSENEVPQLMFHMTVEGSQFSHLDDCGSPSYRRKKVDHHFGLAGTTGLETLLVHLVTMSGTEVCSFAIDAELHYRTFGDLRDKILHHAKHLHGSFKICLPSGLDISSLSPLYYMSEFDRLDESTLKCHERNYPDPGTHVAAACDLHYADQKIVPRGGLGTVTCTEPSLCVTWEGFESLSNVVAQWHQIEDDVQTKAIRKAVVDYLTLHGFISLNAKNENGDTALPLAIQQSKLAEKMTVYLPKEIDGSRVLKNAGKSTMWRATNEYLQAKTGGLPYWRSKDVDDKILTRLIEWDEVIEGLEEWDENGQSEGWVKCIVTSEDVLPLLLKAGITADGRDAHGRTALLQAIHENSWGVATELIKVRGGISIADPLGETPLHAVAAIDQLDIAKLLIEAGCPLEVKNMSGGTPLLVAMTGGKRAVAMELIQAGADVNIAGAALGRSPLHIAAINGHPNLAMALIRARAELEVKDSWGKSPIDIAKKTGTWTYPHELVALMETYASA